MDDTHIPLKEHKRVIAITTVALAIPVLVMVGIVMFWLKYPEKSVEVYNEPMPVEFSQPYPGGTVLVHFNYCKVTNFSGKVVRYLVMKDREIKLPTQNDTSKRGCIEDQAVPVPIPVDLKESGDISVRYELTYHINLIRGDIQQVFVSQPFKLTPHE